MRSKLTPVIFASLLGAGTMLMLPSQASAFTVPAVQRDVIDQAMGNGSDGLYQDVRHRRWHKRHWRHRHGWRHRNRYYGTYDDGYYPRRRWRHRYYDDYGYYGRGPGIYFGFGL